MEVSRVTAYFRAYHAAENSLHEYQAYIGDTKIRQTARFDIVAPRAWPCVVPQSPKSDFHLKRESRAEDGKVYITDRGILFSLDRSPRRTDERRKGVFHVAATDLPETCGGLPSPCAKVYCFRAKGNADDRCLEQRVRHGH